MASQAGRFAAPPADPRLVMPADVSAQAQSRFQAYARGAKPTVSSTRQSTFVAFGPMTPAFEHRFPASAAGITAGEAQNVLAAAGFNVTVAPQASAEVEKDKVIGTRPAAGAKAKKGSTVTVFVSTGPEQSIVPLSCSPGGGSGMDLSVHTGTQVQFVNGGSAPMKVAFETLAGSPGEIEPGGSFTETFTEPGTFAYTCEFEMGNQTGNIYVQSG
jgi:plastocyanin